jgi:glycosyltransferase involved in cell wall biosynthesis
MAKVSGTVHVAKKPATGAKVQADFPGKQNKMSSAFRSVYIAFDPHPSFKGASTHIHHMVEELADTWGPVLLLTLKGPADVLRTETIHQECFDTGEENMLARGVAFARWAKEKISEHQTLVVAHYRDIWGGMAALSFPHLHTIFEVNGVPSIELPYRYPYMASDTLDKLRQLEDFCLTRSKCMITPSYTTHQYLQTRKVPAEKIRVIPNGAEIPSSQERDPLLPFDYMVYVGALQPWQGVDVLFKSLRYLEDLDIPLVICSSYHEHAAKPWRKLAEKLGVEGKIFWKYQLEKPALNQVMQHALFSLAPLTECSRNIEQGCSPLKILESMACGTAVIASKVPPVEEIIVHDEDGILCRPDRPADLARAIRLAIDYPGHMEEMGGRARRKIEQQFTWDHARTELRKVYNNILTFSF